MARIMRQCQMYQKNFSLAKYGTWASAERAGARWIVKQKKTLPPSQMSAKGRMSSRNHSGVVGVYLARRLVRKPSGKEYEYWSWTARWPGCPLRGGVSWHISSNLSDDDAFVLAVLSRQMESVDRERVRRKLGRIHGRASHRAIMEKKILELA